MKSFKSKKKVEIPPGEFNKVRVSVLGIQSSARIIGNWGWGGGWKVGKIEKRKEKRRKGQKKSQT